MAAHAHNAAEPFWTLSLMWFGMMAAMMAPAAWPWVRTYYRFVAPARGVDLGPTAQFTSGYLLAWLGFAIVAALLQRTLHMTLLMQPAGDAVVAPLAAVIFLVAGLYQFAPLKRACLTHCRTPLGYFLTRWVDGPSGAFRMGLYHGAFCVGCCWALMATAFAVGVMNTWWMVVLAVVALVEQIAPQGQLMRRLLGGAFLLTGIARLTGFA